MNYVFRILVICWLISVTIFYGCQESDIGKDLPGSGFSNAWLVPEEEVLRGAAKDAIKALDQPVFEDLHEVSFLQDDDRLLVYSTGAGIRAYPISILNWHEITNDIIGSQAVTISYCPLTGTGIGWRSAIDGIDHSFGVSGLLYNANMIAFDRTTNSLWSQMRMDCINGRQVGRNLTQISLVELSWIDLKKMVSEDVKVLSNKTGFDLPYSSYPYGDYRSNNQFFISPVEFTDKRLPAKHQVFGIIVHQEAMVFPTSSFPHDQVTVLNYVFRGQPIVLIYVPYLDFINAYKSNIDGVTHQFDFVQEGETTQLVDQQGNRYSIFGKPINIGSHLATPKNMSAFWFAWTKFYPRVAVYKS